MSNRPNFAARTSVGAEGSEIRSPWAIRARTKTRDFWWCYAPKGTPLEDLAPLAKVDDDRWTTASGHDWVRHKSE